MLFRSGYSVILDDLLPRVLRLSSKRIGPCHDLFTKSVNTTIEYFRWVQIRLDSVRRIGRIEKEWSYGLETISMHGGSCHMVPRRLGIPAIAHA